MTFDYTSMGFYTFDSLGRPVTGIPKGGDTWLVDEVTIAVSGAAGGASIVAAKHGLNVQAVGGVGTDPMGDWVLQRLSTFGVDTAQMERVADWATSSSIVLTGADGERSVLHKMGATGGFFVGDEALSRVVDAKIVHVGGAGLMDRMDPERTTEVMREAKARGCTTTLDVFAGSREDMALIRPLLPYTDYFMPSTQEAQAITGLDDEDDILRSLVDEGAGAIALTLGERGVKYGNAKGDYFTMPAFEVDVVCTCGCGDSFDAGFATGLHLGFSDEECVRLGQATSAQKLSGLGAQAGVVSLERTLEFMRTAPVKARRGD